MIPTLATLSLSTLALCIATFASVVALRSSGRSLSKRLSELSERLSETEKTVEELTLQLRNLRSRLNMQAHRARKANGDGSPAPDTLPIDSEDAKDRWQREMNLKIATGQVRMR